MELASLLTSLDRLVFTINIQNPQFLSVVQCLFNNCHSLISPTTCFEIDVYCAKAASDNVTLRVCASGIGS